MHKHLNNCIIIILLILLVLSTASCSEPTPPQSETYDSKYHSVPTVGRKTLLPITEGNGVLYFAPSFPDNGSLWFYEFDTGYSAPLCAKPECEHNSKTCNAYFSGSNLRGISIFDNKLWFVGYGPTIEDHAPRIYYEELDGSGRVQKRIFTTEEYNEATGNGRNFFYGGYYFKGGYDTEVIDEVPFRPARVIAYDLETDERIEILNKRFDMFSEVCIQPLDEWLYISVCGLNYGDEEQSFTLYRWNLETRELEELYSGKVGHQFTEMWVDGDRIILISGILPEVYCFSLESKTLSLAWNADPEEEGWFFEAFTEDSAVFRRGDPRGFAIKAIDFSGNTLAEHVYDYQKTQNLYFPCGSDGQYVYRVNHGLGKNPSKLLAIPLDGSEIKTLWSN